MPWWILLSLAAQPGAGLEFFEKSVRPLVNARCVGCHSSKAKVAFGGLHLDTVAGLASVAQAKLLDAVNGRNGLKRMPPAGPLPAAELAVLEQWVKAGAALPASSMAPTVAFDLAKRRDEHWCWQPIRAVQRPAGGFAFERPRAPADRATLLRRVTFDLTGLPPSTEDLARDESFEATVDRLLASPRYGERMARRWMDLIRYSESHGSEGDPDTPHAWRYRDYLIRAFNDDVPYDQLIREHVAGDLIPPRVKDGTNESLLAMAHWRMVEHGFQPVDPWEDRVKWTDNQIDVLTKTFQGLTVSCARCHDHKFDAISQKDYYALFGAVASMRPTLVAVDSDEVLRKNQARLAALKPMIKQALIDRWREQAKGLEAMVKVPGSLPDPLFDLTRDYAAWPRLGVGLPAAASRAGEFMVAAQGERAIEGIYLAGVYSGLLSRKNEAVLTSPRFKIETDALSFQFAGGNKAFAQLIIENYAVPRGGIYQLRTNAKSDELGWFTWDTSFWKGFTAYIEFVAPEEDSWFGARQVVAHKRLANPVDSKASATAAIEAWARDELTDEQATYLNELLKRGLLTNEASAIPVVAEYRKLEAEIAAPRRAPGILDEHAGDHPLLVRGDHKRLGEKVPRGYLTALGGKRFGAEPRWELAQEMASPKNPLTARVMANRLWQWVFREGIVATPDNFGKLGAAPKDPSLLDWLAGELIRNEWSMKKTLRRLLLSPAYQAADLPLRRLEAEEIRDAILAATGQLDLAMYGKPVPVFYAHDTGSTKGDRPKGPLDGAGRRSIYLEIRRNATNPFLEVFDVYKPASTRGQRDVTNVPGQSLAFLNSPFLMEQAAQWAKRDPAIDEMYRRVLGRAATAAERDAAETFVKDTGSKAALAQALFNLKEFVYVR